MEAHLWWDLLEAFVDQRRTAAPPSIGSSLFQVMIPTLSGQEPRSSAHPSSSFFFRFDPESARGSERHLFSEHAQPEIQISSLAMITTLSLVMSDQKSDLRSHGSCDRFQGPRGIPLANVRVDTLIPSTSFRHSVGCYGGQWSRVPRCRIVDNLGR